MDFPTDIIVPSNGSISSVIASMEKLQKFYQAQNHPAFLPFLYVYELVTKTVYERINQFEEPQKLEELDIVFANLYFEPMQHFFSRDNGSSEEVLKKNAAWKVYFEYCSQEKTIPFLTVLLGINAHINSDLLTAVYKTNYSNEHDFMLVNEILEELTPKVMQYLAIHNHDIFGLGGVLFKRFSISEFRAIIVRWRNEVWGRKNILKDSIFDKQKTHYELLTQEVANDLIIMFNDSIHLKHIDQFVSKLNSISVIR